jgi:uncharacterized protein
MEIFMLYSRYMTLQETIRTDMVQAMKAKEEVRLSVLRGLLTMFMQELTATKRTPQDTLTDEEALGVIMRARKQREDSAQQFRAGGRPELAEKEEEEIKVLSVYLPAQLSLDEVREIVTKKIAELNITEMRDMGKLMSALMPEVKGRTDGAVVKQVVDEELKG